MIAETYNYNKVRHADVSVPPGTEPLPYAFLDPFFGRFGKTSRRDVLRILENGAASIPNERKLHPETRTPIANCKMKPNTEPIVQRQPAIHRLRQEIRHVLARRSDRLDPGNYSCGQPVLRFHWIRAILYLLVAQRRRTLTLFCGCAVCRGGNSTRFGERGSQGQDFTIESRTEATEGRSNSKSLITPLCSVL